MAKYRPFEHYFNYTKPMAAKGAATKLQQAFFKCCRKCIKKEEEASDSSGLAAQLFFPKKQTRRIVAFWYI